MILIIAGEVYATIYDERNNIWQPVEGRVAITRSPQIHPGDIQLVNAVRRPQLVHLRNVVVFSCRSVVVKSFTMEMLTDPLHHRGERSLPSMLGGGDLDGDIYNLILNVSMLW